MTLRISAVIPAYNAGKHIERALLSVREQTYPVAEVIVVDDGSTDDTSAVVAQFGGNVVYVRQQNAGPAAARNRGIELASSPWLAFLDADDFWVPEKIATQVALIERHPTLAMVASDMTEVDETGRVLVESMLQKAGLREHFTVLAGAPDPDALRLLVHTNYVPTGTVLARTELVRSLGGFPPSIRYGEDLVLWASIAAVAPTACLPVAHMYRRRHGNNLTGASVPLYRDLVEVMRVIANRCGDELSRVGVDPQRLIADALSDLGYACFREDDFAGAAEAFRDSVDQRLSVRAVCYLALCQFPPALIPWLRRCKQTLATHR